jgi:hypothetical protein
MFLDKLLAEYSGQVDSSFPRSSWKANVLKLREAVTPYARKLRDTTNQVDTAREKAVDKICITPIFHRETIK